MSDEIEDCDKLIRSTRFFADSTDRQGQTEEANQFRDADEADDLEQGPVPSVSGFRSRNRTRTRTRSRTRLRTHSRSPTPELTTRQKADQIV